MLKLSFGFLLGVTTVGLGYFYYLAATTPPEVEVEMVTVVAERCITATGEVICEELERKPLQTLSSFMKLYIVKELGMAGKSRTNLFQQKRRR